MSMKILAAIKKCLSSLIVQIIQDIMINQTNKSWKMKPKALCLMNLLGWSLVMYSFLVDNSEDGKAKYMNRNVAVAI